MKIDVRIDRVVLDGVAITRRERERLGPAIERELRRLVDGAAPGDGVDDAAKPAPGGVDGIAREVAIAVHAQLPAVPAAVRTGAST